MLALGFFGLLEIEAVVDVLLFGCAMAPFTLILVTWFHQWYYRSHTESMLRKITDYIIAKKKREYF